MKSLKKIFSIFGIIVISILMNFVYIKPIKAQVPDLHIKLEVSKDGTHWYNYSGSADADGETLNCNPGDTVIIKVTLWNPGETNIINILGSGSITNSSYIEAISDVNPDHDGNGRDFTEYYFGEFHNGAIDQVDLESTYDDDEESMTAVLTLDDNFPEDQTILIGTATVDSMGEPSGNNEEDKTIEKTTSFFRKFFGGIAYAQEPGLYSQFRIVVNGELPATGADLK